MHVMYTTAQTPWGPSEAFVLPEIMEFERQGHRVTICPLRPKRKLAPGSEAAYVKQRSIRLPLLDVVTVFYACRTALWRPIVSARTVLRLLRYTHGFYKRLKNLVVVPKGLALAWIAQRLRPDHIHAHWASTPSSAAFIAAEITRIPWSFTAHRWDIKDRNALALKISSAAFVRAISQKGAALLRAEVSRDEQNKVLCIHMGCVLDSTSCDRSCDAGKSTGRETMPPVIACPANLLPVKGHEVLIKACSLLRKWGVQFRCIMFGQGPLEQELKLITKREKLDRFIEWRGQIPHDELLKLYADRKISIVVLPSVVTPEGEEEGIPVSLMEAMSSGIPVISTLTGSIPELLHDEAGLLVPERDIEGLALTIRNLLEDHTLYERTAAAGRKRVMDEFSLEGTVRSLVSAMMGTLADI